MTSKTISKLARNAALVLASLAVGAIGMWFVVGRQSTGRSVPMTAASGGAPAAQSPVSGAAPAAVSGADDEGVHISPERQQLIGVRTVKVARHAMENTLRTVGAIAYDETRVAEIHTKIAGWVEDVSVDFVGKQVRKGQPLFKIYSPELVATQREYLLALKADRQLSGSGIQETRDGARSLLEATRQRLRLWDVTDAQVDALTRSGEPQRTLTVYSPSTGIVLERTAFPGQYVTPEMATFKIADLSTLWVIGQVFEYQLATIKLGQPAKVEFPYGQGARTVSGRISFIYPQIDPQTHRAQVRVEVPNPGLDLKPGTFVTLVINTGGGDQLSVPQEAVIDTGTRQYVLLALPDGYFAPRPVTVGPPTDQFYPVLSGLQDGDLVVTSAQFLIDSESNLQAAMQSMTAPTPASAPPGASAPAASAAPPAKPVALNISFTSRPDPPATGNNDLEVAVRDAQGQPVTDVTVDVTFFMAAMPSMGMPAARSAATLAHAGDGVYRGTAALGMTGRWEVTVTVSRAGQRIGRKQLGLVVR